MIKKRLEKLGFHSIDDLEKFLDRDETKKMIGKNYDHYRELWIANYYQGVMGEPKKKVKGRTNWLAIVAYPIWFAYRKMYAIFFGICVAMAAISFGEVYFNYEIPASAYSGTIILAFMAKDIYFEHLIKQVKKVDNMPNKERKESFYKWHGGVSIIFAILSLPIFLTFIFFAGYIASKISGNAMY